MMAYTQGQIEKIKGLGSEWQKGNQHRVYFNNLGYYYGIRTERYNSGNVSSAELDGERISNSQAKRLLSTLAYSKLWFDVADQKFRGNGELSDEMFSKIVAAIKAQL